GRNTANEGPRAAFARYLAWEAAFNRAPGVAAWSGNTATPTLGLKVTLLPSSTTGSTRPPTTGWAMFVASTVSWSGRVMMANSSVPKRATVEPCATDFRRRAASRNMSSAARSEERRVGEEWRSWWWRDH